MKCLGRKIPINSSIFLDHTSLYYQTRLDNLPLASDASSYLQKPSKFTVPIRHMYAFFALFIITKSADNVTKCKKAPVNMNSCLNVNALLSCFDQKHSMILLMSNLHQPSLKRKPSEPVLLALSDPARSTKCNLAHRYSSFILSLGLLSPRETGLSLRICSRVMVKMACERLYEHIPKIYTCYQI